MISFSRETCPTWQQVGYNMNIKQQNTKGHRIYRATFTYLETLTSTNSIFISRPVNKPHRLAKTVLSLKWWRDNAQFYPLLSPMDKAYLSVPATSVPSERVFSTAGDIVNAQTSQLLPGNVDMLIFLKTCLMLSEFELSYLKN